MRDEARGVRGDISRVKGDMADLDRRLREVEDAGGGRGLPAELGAPLRAFWVKKCGAALIAWKWEHFVRAMEEELGPASSGLVATLDAKLLQSRHAASAAACAAQLEKLPGHAPLATSVAVQCVLRHLLDANQDNVIDASELRALHLRAVHLARGRATGVAAAGGLSLLECLTLMVEEACGARTLPPALELTSMLRAEREELRRLLDPLEFKDDVARLYDRLLPGSRDWILRDFDRFIAAGRPQDAPSPPSAAPASSTRVFVVLGGPGMGKSCIAAALATRRRDTVAAVHFCHVARECTRDVRHMVRTLAFQLASRLPAILRDLLTAARALRGDEKPAELLESLIKGPLEMFDASELAAGRTPPPMALLIDALDEAEVGSSRNALLLLITTSFNALPHWLRLVVTSRPEADVKRELKVLGKPTEVDPRDPRHVADLRSYVTHLLRDKLAPGTNAVAAVVEFMSRSGGVFAYVAQVAEARLKHAPKGSLTLEGVKSFPDGLNATYEEAFRRLLFQRKRTSPFTGREVEVDDITDDLAHLLTLLLAFQEPPTLEDIAWATFEVCQHKTLSYWREGMATLGSLFPRSGQRPAVFSPFHKSVLDYLLTDPGDEDLDERAASNLPALKPRCLLEKVTRRVSAGHQLIARRAVTVLKVRTPSCRHADALHAAIPMS